MVSDSLLDFHIDKIDQVIRRTPLCDEPLRWHTALSEALQGGIDPPGFGCPCEPLQQLATLEW